jgi:hypothetical protein
MMYLRQQIRNEGLASLFKTPYSISFLKIKSELIPPYTPCLFLSNIWKLWKLNRKSLFLQTSLCF